MKHYDNEINRTQNWGWFDEYAQEFICNTFGVDNLKNYSTGTLAWEFCSFSFSLTSGERFEGRFVYSECNDGRGLLEIFRKVWDYQECKYNLVPYEN